MTSPPPRPSPPGARAGTPPRRQEAPQRPTAAPSMKKRTALSAVLSFSDRSTELDGSDRVRLEHDVTQISGVRTVKGERTSGRFSEVKLRHGALLPVLVTVDEQRVAADPVRYRGTILDADRGKFDHALWCLLVRDRRR